MARRAKCALSRIRTVRDAEAVETATAAVENRRSLRSRAPSETPPSPIPRRRPHGRIKVLGVQAATDSYIYTFRGFSISRFVECTRSRG